MLNPKGSLENQDELRGGVTLMQGQDFLLETLESSHGSQLAALILMEVREHVKARQKLGYVQGHTIL